MVERLPKPHRLRIIRLIKEGLSLLRNQNAQCDLIKLTIDIGSIQHKQPEFWIRNEGSNGTNWNFLWCRWFLSVVHWAVATAAYCGWRTQVPQGLQALSFRYNDHPYSFPSIELPILQELLLALCMLLFNHLLPKAFKLYEVPWYDG